MLLQLLRTLPSPEGSGMPSPATRMLSPGVTISSKGTDNTLPAAAAAAEQPTQIMWTVNIKLHSGHARQS
jgi:hypothetical protein